MSDVLIPTPENCVVHGGGELGDTPSDGVDQLTCDDRACGHISLLLGSLTHEAIDAELLAGHDDGPIDGVGHGLDVDHPVLTARVIGGERRDEVADPQALQLFGGHVGVGVLDQGELTEPATGPARLQQLLRRQVLVDPGTSLARNDLDLVTGDEEFCVDRLRLVQLPDRVEITVDDPGVERVNDLRCAFGDRLRPICGHQLICREDHLVGGIDQPDRS